MTATAKNVLDSRFPVVHLIDGDGNNFYHSEAKTDHPWVQLELLEGYRVQKVKIINRLDCCWERLKNVEIRVGNHEATENVQGELSSNTKCKHWDGPARKGQVVEIDEGNSQDH